MFGSILQKYRLSCFPKHGTLLKTSLKADDKCVVKYLKTQLPHKKHPTFFNTDDIWHDAVDQHKNTHTNTCTSAHEISHGLFFFIPTQCTNEHEYFLLPKRPCSVRFSQDLLISITSFIKNPYYLHFLFHFLFLFFLLPLLFKYLSVWFYLISIWLMTNSRKKESSQL